MNVRAMYKAAYRNERIRNANFAHMITDRFDYPYYNQSEFAQVPVLIAAKAKISHTEYAIAPKDGQPCTTWYAKNGFQWQAMIREYSKGVENWTRWKKYFKLVK